MSLSRTCSGILLTLLFVCVISSALNIQPARAEGMIYIRADGSIDPPTAPISSIDNVTYTFTDNISGSIGIKRSGIVIDGEGYTLQGPGPELNIGIDFSERVNVTVQHTQIEGFSYGISGIPAGYGGVSNYTISRNNLTNNYYGISLALTAGNRILENNIIGNYVGISLSYETVSYPPDYDPIYYDIILGNNIVNNQYGIQLYQTGYGVIYHNNFIGNYQQVYNLESTIVWYSNYPFGGNYWSDYVDVDSHSGEYQNKTGGDGIWDHPYVMDANNQDNYPLVSPFWYWNDPILGDVNKDMRVDGKDVVFVARHWSPNVGNSNYDSLYDLNDPKDGKIDGKDLALLAKYFNTHYL